MKRGLEDLSYSDLIRLKNSTVLLLGDARRCNYHLGCYMEDLHKRVVKELRKRGSM